MAMVVDVGGTNHVARRNASAKGNYGSPEDAGDIGWFPELVGALLFTPWMLLRFLLWPKFEGIEKAALDAVELALPSEMRATFRKQIRTVNFVQRATISNATEATFFRWRLVRMQTRNLPKFENHTAYCVLFATVRLQLDNKEFVADFLSYNGILSFINFSPDPYEYYDRDDFVVLDVDLEPVAIDKKGKFQRFL